MREIKFRGKRIDNGEWVFGDYSRYSKDQSIIMVDLLEQEDYWVASETVGQYTGLKDKNGKDIYEGDILHKDFYWGWYVEFEDGAFCRIPTNEVQRINWAHYRMNQNDVEDWEVIGSIYDNPELMENKK